MPELQTLGAFAVAAYVFALVPGPAVIYVVTRSIDQGRMAGVVSVLGIASGTLVHVVAATLGLSALLMSSAVAYSVVKYAGASYLIFLGVRTLLRRDEEAVDRAAPAPVPLKRLYRQGIVVAILNPKNALFFLAFLPQFVDPARGPVALQMGLLGILLVLIAAASDCSYALLSGTAANWLKGNTRILRRRRVLSGSVYIGLGISAALTSSQTK